MSEELIARWEQRHEAGRRACSRGQLADADKAFLSAVHEAELLGPASAQLATSLNALGQLRTQQKDYTGAEPLLARALAIRETAFGREGHALVPTLNALATVLDARGEYDRAESLLRRALGISEHQLGPAHPEVSVGLSNLARLYFKRRDFAKADRLLLRLLEIKRGVGKDHPEVATVLGSLARLRQVVGKHAHAEQLWRQALAIRERCFAPNDTVIATTLESVADCCAPVPGRVSEAIALRERALRIREQAIGANGPATSAARVKLDELRARSDTTAAPEPLPPRSSKELPSPITSQEVPAMLSDHAPLPRPSSDLPWIDVHDSDHLAGSLDIMLPSASVQRQRTPSASVTPMGVPRQRAGPLPGAPSAPIAPSGVLDLSESIAPQARIRETTSGRAPRYDAPTDSRRPVVGRIAPRVERRHSSTSTKIPARRPRLPAEMARRGSSKRLVVVGTLVIVLAGGGWSARGQLETARFPFIHRAAHGSLSMSQSARRAALPVPVPMMARDSQAGHVAPRGATQRAKRISSDGALRLTHLPAAGTASEIDAVTSGVEQSTRSRLDSVQKPRIDDKAPLFKKP